MTRAHLPPARCLRGLACLVLLAGLSGSACAAPDDPAATREIPPFEVPAAREGVRYVRALVFGDWGTGTKSQRAAAAAMVARIQRAGAGPNFVLTTGDNFYPSGVQSASDPIWAAYFEKIYAAPEFQVPWRPTLGNHDYKGEPAAQIAYSEWSQRWQMPARYYSFTQELDGGEQVEFFALDTQRMGYRSEDAEQLAWLRERLSKSKARWKIAYGHHPLYSHSKRPYNQTLIRRLEPLFVEHGVDLYMAGHDHVLELLKPVRGVNYLVSGAGGGPSKAYRVTWGDKSHYAATGGGFVWLRVSKDELVIEFCRMKGETQFAHVLSKARRREF